MDEILELIGERFGYKIEIFQGMTFRPVGLTFGYTVSPKGASKSEYHNVLKQIWPQIAQYFIDAFNHVMLDGDRHAQLMLDMTENSSKMIPHICADTVEETATVLKDITRLTDWHNNLSSPKGQMMETQYVGTNVVTAESATRLEYCEYRQWDVPVDEHKEDAGYIITDVTTHRDTWILEGDFLNRYRNSSTLDFGRALDLAKQGAGIARAGWNGKGIHVAIQRTNVDSDMSGSYLYIDTTDLQTDNPDAPKVCVPWAPSQTDILAEDWCVVV